MTRIGTISARPVRSSGKTGLPREATISRTPINQIWLYGKLHRTILSNLLPDKPA